MHNIFTNSFVYAGGPGLIICVLLCFSAYFNDYDQWQNKINKSPINDGLQSLPFRYSLVAVIAASTPPLLELTADIIISKENLTLRTFLMLSALFSLVLEASFTLIFVSPQPDAKLYLCSSNASLIVYLFLESVLLSEYSPKFWKTKWCTFAVTCVYVGCSISTFPPYFNNNKMLDYISTYLQFMGCAIFIILSYKFLKTKLPDDQNSGHFISDDLLCRFIAAYTVMVMIGRITLYFSAGSPYWTDYTGIYLCIQNIITYVPNIGACMAFSHAARNEAFFIQVLNSYYVFPINSY